MVWSVFFGYMWERLHEAGLYWLVLVVGLMINLYGQVLVPRLRKLHPFAAIREEATLRPKLFALSVTVGFLFPLFVSVISSATTSYASRHVYERANFPDEKPDPVFRVDLNGAFVDMGRSTRELLDRYPANDVEDILGSATWAAVSEAHRHGRPLANDTAILHGGQWYLVTQSASSNGKLINIYLARLANRADSICRPDG
jgi:hypothetical protein